MGLTSVDGTGRIAELRGLPPNNDLEHLATHLFLHQPRVSLDGTEVLASPYDRLAEAKRANPIPEFMFTGVSSTTPAFLCMCC